MFPRKQTLRQRLLWRMFTKECSQSQHLCKREDESGMGQREKLSSPTTTSVNPTRSCEHVSELSSVGVRELNLYTSLLISHCMQDAPEREHDLK